MNTTTKYLSVFLNGTEVGEIELVVINGGDKIKYTKRIWNVKGNEEFIKDYTNINNQESQNEYEKKYHIEQQRSNKKFDHTASKFVLFKDSPWTISSLTV